MKLAKEKTVKELREMAAELGIVGRHNMVKAELISAIEEEQKEKEEAERFAKVVANQKEIKTLKKDNFEECLATQVEAEKVWDEDEQTSKKSDYINRIEVGSMIAFAISQTKALSGMVIECQSGKYVVETKNGNKFNIRRSKILWVKTGERWPKGIFDMLKGNNHNE